MFQYQWSIAFTLTLAWVGGTLGQQAAPTPPHSSGVGPMITVREAGQPPQQCQILSSWTLPNGDVVQRVRDVRSGEVMTIVNSPESGNAPSAIVTPKQVFHSTGSPVAPSPSPNAASIPKARHVAPVANAPPLVQTSTQPPRTPMNAPAVIPSAGNGPPSRLPSSVVESPTQTQKEPPTAGEEATPTPKPILAYPGDRILCVQEAGKPEQQCKVLRTFTMPTGEIAHEVQDLASGEIMTILEGPGMRIMTCERCVPLGEKLSEAACRFFSRGRHAIPGGPMCETCEECQAPLAMPVPNVDLAGSATPRDHAPLLSRLFRRNQCLSPNAGPMLPCSEYEPEFASAPPRVKAVVEVAQPSDWRQSWGLARGHETQATTPPVPVVKAVPLNIVDRPAASKPQPQEIAPARVIALEPPVRGNPFGSAEKPSLVKRITPPLQLPMGPAEIKTAKKEEEPSSREGFFQRMRQGLNSSEPTETARSTKVEPKDANNSKTIFSLFTATTPPNELPQAKKDKDDPLCQPKSFSRVKEEKKEEVAVKKPEQVASVQEKPKKPEPAKTSDKPAQGPPATETTARETVPTRVVYVPVPIFTNSSNTAPRPPLPPQPNIPQPPQPIRAAVPTPMTRGDRLNAFAEGDPQAIVQEQADQDAGLGNAFHCGKPVSPEKMFANAFTTPVSPIQPESVFNYSGPAMAQMRRIRPPQSPNGPLPPHMAMAAMPPYGPLPPYAQAGMAAMPPYGPLPPHMAMATMSPYGPMPPYASAGMLPMPPGYGVGPVPPYGHGPRMPQMYPANATAKAGRFPFAGSSSTMPRLPVPMYPPQGGPIMQVGYQLAPLGQPVASAGRQSVTDRGGNLQPLLQTLRSAIYPTHREWAAESLGQQADAAQKEVVQALLKTAQEDAAATVRCACIRSLVHLKVYTPQVREAVQGLQSDNDPRVRQEAAAALKALEAMSPSETEKP